MNVRLFLLRHRAHVVILTTFGCVIVAHQQPGFVRQFKYLLQGSVKRSRVATREIAAGGSVVGHEQGVPDKSKVIEDIGYAGCRVSGRMQHPTAAVAKADALVVFEQPIELTAVHCHIQLKRAGEPLLNLSDPLADPKLRADEMLLQVAGGRKMICMHVGFQNPLHDVAVGLDELEDLIGQDRGYVAAVDLIVEDRVNDGAGAAARIGQHIAVRAGVDIEERMDDQIHHAPRANQYL